MKKTLIMCFMLATVASFGQKNAVKLVLAPGKLALANNVGLAYERKFTDRFTGQLKFNFSSKDAAPLSGKLTEFTESYLDSANTAADIFKNKFNSTGLSLELRYYLGAKALKGFYIAPYVGIQQGTFENFDFNFPDQTNDLLTHGGNVEIDFNFIGGGIGIGNHWTIANKLSIDILWLGLGVGTNNFSLTGVELPGEEVDFDYIESQVSDFVDKQSGMTQKYLSNVETIVHDTSIELKSKNLVPYTKALNISIGFCF